jgi:predicted nucleotidyltransferase component of viral defense system
MIVILSRSEAVFCYTLLVNSTFQKTIIKIIRETLTCSRIAFTNPFASRVTVELEDYEAIEKVPFSRFEEVAMAPHVARLL